MGPKEHTNGHAASVPGDPAALRKELERILASSEFRSSRRHSSFLRYVVEEALNGNAAALKERSVGVAVFGLDPAYDTSTNPVVRVSAGELRKRLFQYYHAPDRGSELRIDLPPGSYVPVFSSVPAETAEPELQQAARGHRPGARAIIATAGAIVLLALALWLKPWASQSAFDQFWRPVWDSPGQALLVVAARSQADDNGRPSPERVNINDSIALARLTPVLGGHGKDFRILTQSTTTLADLKQGPAILIAAFTNDLSMRLMREARFNFEIDEATKRPAIRDRQNPSNIQWRLERPPGDPAAPYTDYAIISRVRDPATGHLAVVAGGITAAGTRSVGEFLGNAYAMAAIAPKDAREWRGKNVQIVLAIQVTPGSPGRPRVLTTYSW